MLSISNPQRNANEKHNEISPHTCQNGYHQNINNNKCWPECEEKETLVHRWWECRLVQPFWKAVWRNLKKLKMDLPFDPAMPLLGIYPKEPKTLIQKNTSAPVFIAALFTITKIWKQPKWSTVMSE